MILIELLREEALCMTESWGAEGSNCPAGACLLVEYWDADGAGASSIGVAGLYVVRYAAGADSLACDDWVSESGREWNLSGTSGKPVPMPRSTASRFMTQPRYSVIP